MAAVFGGCRCFVEYSYAYVFASMWVEHSLASSVLKNGERKFFLNETEFVFYRCLCGSSEVWFCSCSFHHLRSELPPPCKLLQFLEFIWMSQWNFFRWGGDTLMWLLSMYTVLEWNTGSSMNYIRLYNIRHIFTLASLILQYGLSLTAMSHSVTLS